MRLQTLVEEFKTSFKHLRGETIEVFVNPTKKELDSIRDKFSKKSASKYDKLIRWAANNKTKKVYAWKGIINHDSALRRINVVEHGESSFDSPHWLTGAILENKFESDKLMSTQIITSRMIKQSWKWAEKYLPGLNKFLDTFRKKK